MTASESFNAIQAGMGKVLVGAGLVSQGAFDAGMADANINNQVRVSWKYACSKAVLGTPTFFVNGVNVAADPCQCHHSTAPHRACMHPAAQAT